MRALRKENLEMNVFDDLTREDDEPIGTASVPLGALAEGEPIVGAFDLRSPSGTLCGQLFVNIRWRIPLQIGNIGSVGNERALDTEEIRYMERRFETRGKNGANTGNVSYKQFLRYVVPQAEFLSVQNKVRNACMQDRGKSLRSAVRRYERNNGEILLTSSEVEDIFEDVSGRTNLLSRMEMNVLFEHLDPVASKMIEPKRFLEFCSPPDTQAQVTEDKLRAYFRSLHRNRPDYREEFRQFDSGNTGSITRPEFRKALVNCGMTVEGTSIDKKFRDGITMILACKMKGIRIGQKVHIHTCVL